MTFGAELFFLDDGQPASRLKPFVRAFLVFGFAAIVLGFAIHEFHEATAMNRWQKTACTVTYSYVESDGVGRYRRSPYRPKVVYTYQAFGRTQLSSKIDTYSDATDDAREAYATTRPYVPGQQAVCYARTEAPSDAVLIQPTVWLNTLFLVGASLLTLLLTWFYCLPQIGLRKLQARRPQSEMGPAGKLLLGLILLAMFGSILVWFYVIPLVRAVQSLNWPAAPCRIVESNLLESDLGEFHVPTYRTDIHYAYIANGVEYHSNQFSVTECSSISGATREEFLKRYPSGAQTICFVNPADPSEAVLSRTVSPSVLPGGIVLMMTLLPCMLIASALGMNENRLGNAVTRNWRPFVAAIVVWLLAIIWGQFAPP